MSAAQFTPGPWRVVHKGHLMFNIEAGPDYLNRTFVAFTGAGAEIPSEANAHLIAAAPELYDALDAIMSERWRPEGRSEAVSDMARAALAKARWHLSPNPSHQGV